ncbi:RNA polymerase sigma factor [Caldithrix abyssi]|nr:RNA polymerase sigma factor [Caldithrix abyssi]
MEKLNKEIDGLLNACRLGDEDAYRQLFEQYHKRIFHVAFRFCGNIQEAEDITQEVFLKVFKGISNFRENSGFFTWIYRITVNVCLDKNRTRQRRDKYFIKGGTDSIMDNISEDATDHVSNPSSQILHDELQQTLQTALNQMNSKLRTVIVLKHLQGLSYQEVAKIIGCSEGTISSRLNRARRQLKHILLHMGVDETHFQTS